MIGLLIVTHGNLGQELLNSAELIVGHHNQVMALGLMPGDNIDQFRERVQEFIKAMDTGDGVLVLVDLFGGSPCNMTAMNMGLLSEGDRIECITGVNLPIMIEALTMRNGCELSCLKEQCIEAGHNGIRDLFKELNSST